MRISNGFTLAEVLITLGIIGVVASVTLPSLSIDVEKRKVGPALAKAIGTLENANNLALVEGESRKLSNLSGMPNNPSANDYLNTAIGKYVIFSKSSANNVTTFTTKDGISFTPSGSKTALGNGATMPDSAVGEYYTVVVDINGDNKGKGAAASDRFTLRVDDGGSVFPVGSTNYHTTGSANWTTTCKQGMSPAETVVYKY